MTQVDGAGAPFGVESPVYVAIRFVQFCSLIVLLGAVLFRGAILPNFLRSGVATDPETMHLVLRRVATWVAGAIMVCAAMQFARLAAQHVAYFERDLPSVESLRALVMQSGWGRAWMTAVAACVVAWIGMSRIRDERRHGWWLLGLSGVTMAWTMSRSGHPAAAARGAELLDVLHVVGAGGWIGGLWMVCIVAIPVLKQSTNDRVDRDIARLVGAFSPVALCFTALLGVSGLVAAWRNVGTWSSLLDSTYGQLLLRKVVVVVAMVAVGAFNWKRVLPRLGVPHATLLLARTARVELLLALVVLVVTAVLVATEMPG